MKIVRFFVAEAFGTAVLVFAGLGTAVLQASSSGLIVGLSYAVAFTAVVAALGTVATRHLNPVVSVAMALRRRIRWRALPGYVVSQAIGALAGASLVFAVANGQTNFSAENNFAANGYGAWSPGNYHLVSAAVIEMVLTAAIVVVVLRVARPDFPVMLGAAAVGALLLVVQLMSTDVDNGAVNPARSAAAALFSGREALKQLWAFAVFPLAGAVIGAAVSWVLDPAGAKAGPAVAEEPVIPRPPDLPPPGFGFAVPAAPDPTAQIP